MPYSKLFYWSQYVDILEAREQLRNFESSSYPQMKRDAMKAVHKDYKRRALPVELDKIHTFEELAEQLKGLKRAK